MRRDSLRVHMLDGDLPDGLALIGLLPGEHFVHHDAEGVEVASRVRQLAARLLGRDVVDRADGLPVALVGLVFQRGNAEVLDLDRTVAQHQDILGLDVAVDDPALVGVRERARDLPREVQDLPPVQHAALVHILPQGDTVYQLHHYVFDIVAVADVIDAHDVWVREHGDSVGLRTEIPAELLVGRHFLAHDLDRDAAVEASVHRPVDNGHAALADQLEDLIALVQDLADILVLMFHRPLRSGLSA